MVSAARASYSGTALGIGRVAACGIGSPLPRLSGPAAGNARLDMQRFAPHALFMVAAAARRQETSLDCGLGRPLRKRASCGANRAAGGRAGYLREAYHGGLYATKYLVAEAFASDDATAEIPARVLRRPLARAAVLVSMYRQAKLYSDADLLALRLDASDGKVLRQELLRLCETMADMVSHTDIGRSLSRESPQSAARLIESRALPPAHQSFVDFVELCERKERETGSPCRILASY
jgi:hypothetical protein